MDNAALILIVVIIFIIVMAFLVWMYWSSDPTGGFSLFSNLTGAPVKPPVLNGASQVEESAHDGNDGVTLEKASQVDGDHNNLDFAICYARLGVDLFDAVEQIESDNLAESKKKIYQDIEKLAESICDQDSQKNFISLYKKKVDLLLKHCSDVVAIQRMASTFSELGDSGDSDETPSSPRSSDYNDNPEFAKVRMQLQVLSAGLAESVSRCLSVKKNEMAKVFGIADGIIVHYNYLKNVRKSTQARSFREKQMKLWTAVKVQNKSMSTGASCGMSRPSESVINTGSDWTEISA